LIDGHNFVKNRRALMHRVLVIPAAIALSATLLSGPALAAGCPKGAVVGGVAGHYAGNHGLLGAGAGCLIGRHYANKHARQPDEL